MKSALITELMQSTACSTTAPALQFFFSTTMAHHNGNASDIQIKECCYV